MATTILAAEPALRLAAFAGVLALMLGWEWLAPRRRPDAGRFAVRANNLALLVVDTLLLRITFPIVAVGMAVLAGDRGWGLFNQVTLPPALTIIAALLALDFVIYLQHRLFHAVPWLWRLHRVHHADTGIDVTTALRFHPLEIGLSMLIKLAAVALLGAPPVAVLLFEILLNATAMFNHANIDVPARADAALRLMLVTPDMHRVHHSVVPAETNSNFGFNLPWWDRLFRTYRAQPAAGHTAMTIGLDRFRDRRDSRLDRLLVQPLAR